MSLYLMSEISWEVSATWLHWPARSSNWNMDTLQSKFLALAQEINMGVYGFRYIMNQGNKMKWQNWVKNGLNLTNGSQIIKVSKIATETLTLSNCRTDSLSVSAVSTRLLSCVSRVTSSSSPGEPNPVPNSVSSSHLNNTHHHTFSHIVEMWSTKSKVQGNVC